MEPKRLNVESARFALNPDLPVEDLRRRFAKDGRLLVSQVLRAEGAIALGQCLERESRWGL
jgi:hypothetical protein